MGSYNLFWQLQELHLIRSSLLPGEHFSFILAPEDTAIWSSLLENQAYNTTPATGPDSISDSELHSTPPQPCQARFSVKVQGSQVWFEIQVPSNSAHFRCADVSVKGENISRDQQEFWQSTVRQKMESDAQESEFPIYDLLVLHLLPMLYERIRHENLTTPATEVQLSDGSIRPENYHALLTSHHLVSPTKRKFMQQWSSELSISGFAKIGHPGLIYAEGDKENVDEFVRNIRAMQWLALKVRFIEPIEPSQHDPGQRWMEVEKVGEVLALMRRLGREKHITNFGIGSISSE